MSDGNGPEVPPGWAVANLEDVVEILDGQRVPVNAKERSKRGGDVPYYGATGRVGWIDNFLFDEELVLLGEDGAPFFDKTRHVAYRVTGKSWVNNHAHVLRPVGALVGPLLAYELNVVDYRPYVGGTTRWKLNQEPMRRITLKIPPVGEQVRLRDLLDELLSDVEAGVVALERVRAKLAHYRASVLKAAVEGALTAEWRQQNPKVEPASELLQRILAERRRRWEEEQLRKFKEKGQEPFKNWKTKYQEPAPPDTANLPALPESWCWATIEQLSEEVRNGYSLKPTAECGVPILRISSVRSCSLDLSDVRYLSGQVSDYCDSLIRERDLLFTRYNGTKSLVGVCAVVPELTCAFVHPDKLIRARPASSCFASSFVALAANVGASRRFLGRRIRTTAGQAGVSGGDIKELPVPLPPRAEQDAIVEMVEDQLSFIEHVEAEIDAKLASAQTLRQSILNHAFTGQLVSQDPSDEPASELLKRIAAERGNRERTRAKKTSVPADRRSLMKKETVKDN